MSRAGIIIELHAAARALHRARDEAIDAELFDTASWITLIGKSTAELIYEIGKKLVAGRVSRLKVLW